MLAFLICKIIFVFTQTIPMQDCVCVCVCVCACVCVCLCVCVRVCVCLCVWPLVHQHDGKWHPLVHLQQTLTLAKQHVDWWYDPETKQPRLTKEAPSESEGAVQKTVNLLSGSNKLSLPHHLISPCLYWSCRKNVENCEMLEEAWMSDGMKLIWILDCSTKHATPVTPFQQLLIWPHVLYENTTFLLEDSGFRCSIPYKQMATSPKACTSTQIGLQTPYASSSAAVIQNTVPQHSPCNPLATMLSIHFCIKQPKLPLLHTTVASS